MTEEMLIQIIDEQNKRIAKLEYDLDSLRKWSDLNDYWLREMINALTDNLDMVLGIDHSGEE